MLGVQARNIQNMTAAHGSLGLNSDNPDKSQHWFVVLHIFRTLAVARELPFARNPCTNEPPIFHIHRRLEEIKDLTQSTVHDKTGMLCQVL